MTKRVTAILCGWKGVRIRVSIRVDSSPGSTLRPRDLAAIQANVLQTLTAALTSTGVPG